MVKSFWQGSKSFYNFYNSGLWEKDIWNDDTTIITCLLAFYCFCLLPVGKSVNIWVTPDILYNYEIFFCCMIFLTNVLYFASSFQIYFFSQTAVVSSNQNLLILLFLSELFDFPQGVEDRTRDSIKFWGNVKTLSYEKVYESQLLLAQNPSFTHTIQFQHSAFNDFWFYSILSCQFMKLFKYKCQSFCRLIFNFKIRYVISLFFYLEYQWYFSSLRIKTKLCIVPHLPKHYSEMWIKFGNKVWYKVESSLSRL